MSPEGELKKPKIPWTPEERSRLLELREQNPNITWVEFNKKFPFPNRTAHSVITYYWTVAPEGVVPRKKRKRRNKTGDDADDGDGGSTATKRCRWKYLDGEEENVGDEGDGVDEAEVEDRHNLQDGEETDHEAGDISFNGMVEPFKHASPSTNSHNRRVSYPIRPVHRDKHPVLFSNKTALKTAAITPQFVAARTIHSTDPSNHVCISNPIPPGLEPPFPYPAGTNPITSTEDPFMFVPRVTAQLHKNEQSVASEVERANTSISKRLESLERHVHSTLREHHAAWTEVVTQLAEVKAFGGRLDNNETAAVKSREEIIEIKKDMKKMQEETSREKKAITGIVSWLGNLKVIDLFNITGGRDGDDLKVEPPNDAEKGSEGLPTRTPECDSESEHLRAWSG